MSMSNSFNEMNILVLALFSNCKPHPRAIVFHIALVLVTCLWMEEELLCLCFYKVGSVVIWLWIMVMPVAPPKFCVCRI